MRSPTDGTARLLRRYWGYQAAASCVFFSPVFFVYYERRVGLSVPAILWLQAWYLGVRAVLDLPLGAVADRHSRRACLVAFALLHALGAALLLAVPSPAAAVVAETVFAAGAACKSGADSAFLFDALRARGRLDLYPRAESRTQAIVSLAAGATAVAGGFLAALDLRLPYLATLVAALGSAALLASTPEDPPASARRPSARALLGEAARRTRAEPPVRWALGLAAFAVVASHVYFYLQQPYLQALGVPVALFGVVFAATKVVTALVANGAHRLDLSLGPRGAAAIMAVTPALGLGAMSLAAGAPGVALLLTRGLLDGLWQPLANVYMNRLVASHVRATMLSAQSVAARLALAGALALLGAGTARIGLRASLAVAAAAAAALGGLLVVTAPRAAGGGRA